MRIKHFFGGGGYKLGGCAETPLGSPPARDLSSSTNPSNKIADGLFRSPKKSRICFVQTAVFLQQQPPRRQSLMLNVSHCQPTPHRHHHRHHYVSYPFAAAARTPRMFSGSPPPPPFPPPPPPPPVQSAHCTSPPPPPPLLPRHGGTGMQTGADNDIHCLHYSLVWGVTPRSAGRAPPGLRSPRHGCLSAGLVAVSDTTLRDAVKTERETTH